MRAGRGAPSWRRGALCVLLPALLAGCAGHRGFPPLPAPELLPPGSPLLSRTLSPSDAWLRHYLISGEYPTALDALGGGSPIAPDDRLLRALQEGLVLRQAGKYARSNEVLEWAEGVAEDRYTRSLTRAAGSLLVSDRVLLYTPSAGERVMLPYYRMLNYLDLGDLEGAKVEARRAAAMLERAGERPAARCAEDAIVLFLAAAVQRQGGEPGEAEVTLRQARHLASGCPGADLPADSLPGEPAGEGTVLVVLEQDFIAHRAEAAFHLALDPAEVDGLDGDDEEGLGALATRIAARLEHDLAQRAAWGESVDDQPLVQWASALGGAYNHRLAWPRLAGEPRRAPPPRLLVDGADAAGGAAPLLLADLSAVARAELEGERAAILARMVARGLTRYLVTREVEDEAEERGGEAASFLVGALANLAANRLERADTRSWSLLPDRISVARLRLPAGSHHLRLETAGGAVRDLGEVSVGAGSVRVVTRRLWGVGEDRAARPEPLTSSRSRE
jgi:hypothetical protein